MAPSLASALGSTRSKESLGTVSFPSGQRKPNSKNFLQALEEESRGSAEVQPRSEEGLERGRNGSGADSIVTQSQQCL